MNDDIVLLRAEYLGRFLGLADSLDLLDGLRLAKLVKKTADDYRAKLEEVRKVA